MIDNTVGFCKSKSDSLPKDQEFTHDCVTSMQVFLVVKVYPALGDFAHFDNPSFFIN